MLDHHDRIGSFRQHPARMDQRALGRFQRQIGGFAHMDFANQIEIGWQRLPGSISIGGPDGVAIYGGAAELGQRGRSSL